MSNEESYVSSLEQLQSDSRTADERRCRNNDATIDQQNTYENEIDTASDQKTNASSAEVAMLEETDISDRSFDRLICFVVASLFP